MEPFQFQTALGISCLIGFFAWRHLRFAGVKSRLPDLLAQGGVVIDVRSKAEYAAGARPDSLNIPLADLPAKLSKLDRAKPVIVCCASGTRSGMAAGILKRNGFKLVFNAGPLGNTI